MARNDEYNSTKDILGKMSASRPHLGSSSYDPEEIKKRNNKERDYIDYALFVNKLILQRSFNEYRIRLQAELVEFLERESRMEEEFDRLMKGIFQPNDSSNESIKIQTIELENLKKQLAEMLKTITDKISMLSSEIAERKNRLLAIDNDLQLIRHHYSENWVKRFSDAHIPGFFTEIKFKLELPDDLKNSLKYSGFDLLFYINTQQFNELGRIIGTELKLNAIPEHEINPLINQRAREMMVRQLEAALAGESSSDIRTIIDYGIEQPIFQNAVDRIAS